MSPKGLIDIHPLETRISPEERQQRMQNPGFGNVFSEHMVVVPYRIGEGWLRGELRPYAPLTLSPAANVLHYGQAIFEGFKAYRQPDGGIRTFRTECNARRFNLSAERLAMPPVPEELFLEASDLLIRTDHAWVPEGLDAERTQDKSYYVRPFMIGTGSYLGVRAADEYLFMVMGGPVGAYFQGGIKPLSIWVEEAYVRAAPGGTGRAKCAGNYAASLLPGSAAKKRGCDQVLYLDATERKYLEELGGMNVFLVLQEGDRTVIATPEKSGSILEGVTRDSLITVAREMGHVVEERRITLDDVLAAQAAGTLKEAFACGTAAVISPIGTLVSAKGRWTINDNQLGAISMQLRATLLDIQYGFAPDTHGWTRKIL